MPVYALEVRFAIDGEATDEVVDSVQSLLAAWYKNGQIVAPIWALASIPGGLKAHVLCAAPDAYRDYA